MFVAHFIHADACDYSSFCFTTVECSIVYNTVSLSILLLTDMWVISCFELMRTVLLRSFLYVSSSTCVQRFLWDIFFSLQVITSFQCVVTNIFFVVVVTNI